MQMVGLFSKASGYNCIGAAFVQLEDLVSITCSANLGGRLFEYEV
jgi:hypothetical protein